MVSFYASCGLLHTFFPKLVGNFNMAGMTELLADFASKKIDKKRM